MGGGIPRSRGTPTRGVPTPRDQRRDIPQRLVYRTAKKVLSVVFPFLLLHPLFSTNFIRCEKDDGKATAGMQADTGVQKVTRLFSGPRGIKTKATRPRALQNVVKGVVYVYTPLLLLAYHTLYREGYCHRIQNGSHDCRGPTKV
jgi:hypothetical protein